MKCRLFNHYNQGIMLYGKNWARFLCSVLRVTIVRALILLLLILCIPSVPVSADLGTDLGIDG